MSTLLRFSIVLLCIAFIAPVVADENAAVPQRLVSIEVAIVDLAGHGERVGNLDADAADKVVARVKELQGQGKVAGYSKIRLSSVEGRPASAQFGERAAVATGRVARGFPGGAAGGGAGGGFSTAYSQVDIGTLVQVVPQIDEDGTILLDLQVEKTGLARAAQAEGEGAADAAVAAPKMVTVSAKSTLRLQNGQTRVAYGSDTSSAKDSTETVILVTARFDGAEGIRAAREGQAELKIFRLRNAASANLAKVLSAVFREQSLRISSDDRSNSLIVKGTPRQLAAIEAVLVTLDEEQTGTP